MIVQGRDYEHTLEFDRFGAACGLTYQPGDAGAIARLVLSGGAFDVAEFSLSASMILADRGNLPVVLVPVFPARAFFHSYLFVRSDSRLSAIQDLSGIRIGLRDFTSTGAIWFRGLLHTLGLDWRSITWVTGPSARFVPPADAWISPATGDLEQMLLDGEIDLFFSARVKDSARLAAERRIRPLLADARAQEAASRAFPIIHAVALSKQALAARPSLAREVFETYSATKRQALKRKLGASFMPWADSNWIDATAIFGDDPLPYGLTEGNRRMIESLGAHLAAQGLTSGPVPVDSLFHPDSAAWGAG